MECKYIALYVNKAVTLFIINLTYRTQLLVVSFVDRPRLTDPFKNFEIESNIGQRSYISFNISSATLPYISWTYDPGPVGKLGYWNIQEIGEEIYQLCSTIVPYDHSHFKTYEVRVRNSVGILNINVVLVGQQFAILF